MSAPNPDPKEISLFRSWLSKLYPFMSTKLYTQNPGPVFMQTEPSTWDRRDYWNCSSCGTKCIPEKWCPKGCFGAILDATVYSSDGDYLGHWDGQKWRKLTTRPNPDTMPEA